MPATSIPCTDKSTICARRHVTTEPDERRTIRSSLLPSSGVTFRIDKPSLDMQHLLGPTTSRTKRARPRASGGGPLNGGEGSLPRH